LALQVLEFPALLEEGGFGSLKAATGIPSEQPKSQPSRHVDSSIRSSGLQPDQLRAGLLEFLSQGVQLRDGPGGTRTIQDSGFTFGHEFEFVVDLPEMERIGAWIFAGRRGVSRVAEAADRKIESDDLEGIVERIRLNGRMVGMLGHRVVERLLRLAELQHTLIFTTIPKSTRNYGTERISIECSKTSS
jgi:hypothetical protein